MNAQELRDIGVDHGDDDRFELGLKPCQFVLIASVGYVECDGLSPVEIAAQLTARLLGEQIVGVDLAIGRLDVVHAVQAEPRDRRKRRQQHEQRHEKAHGDTEREGTHTCASAARWWH
ncbi:MAG: hypothetical protein ACYDHN_02970 [Solirubrobacteraceae bacterium]